MSQRGEKYARAMEHRVARLEEQIEKIGFDVTAQGVRLTTAAELMEAMALPTCVIKSDPSRDKLDVPTYSAEAWPQVMNADWEPSHATPEDHRAERREARRRRNVRRRVAALCMAALAVVLLLIAVTEAVGAEPDTTAGEKPVGIVPVMTAAPELWDGEGEDPLEAEKIEAALLAQGYFSDAVPLSHDLQDIMRTACVTYGCPYPMALAVAETESQFDQEAVGAAGEVGIMQLTPGPGGAYHAELEAVTGQDPATPSGNIICGVYLLGKYMAAYEDPAMAAMAYNMGEAGAKKAWAAGVTSTDYSAAVLDAMARWECLVDPWAGI